MSSAMACSGSSQAMSRTKSPLPSARAAATICVDGAGGEAALDDLPQPGVLGRIHVEHDQPLAVDAGAVHVGVEADDRGVACGREGLRVDGDLLDVGVPGHRPVAAVVETGRPRLLGYPAHRLGPAQQCELGKRDPGLVDVRVGEVEAFWQRGAGHRWPPVN
jgi:hypothetical protein